MFSDLIRLVSIISDLMIVLVGGVTISSVSELIFLVTSESDRSDLFVVMVVESVGAGVVLMVLVISKSSSWV